MQADLNPEAIKVLQRVGDKVGESDYVSKILGIFKEDSVSSIARIDNGLKDYNGEIVKFAAHKLKGGARSIGADALADECHSLQAVAEKDDFDRSKAMKIASKIKVMHEHLVNSL